MGPLVPFILSKEFGLVLALVIGFAFGFILEQAGFSSTKKLVGLFYGYDFTVLRVFFTAGVTAMVGVMILSHVGLLDLSLIYVNPTFTRSAITGGLIMGMGFVIGGFCPGTSMCAAAIGKLDAMAFIIGSLIGIFAFIGFYPQIIDFYKADALGQVTINESLGISRMAFAYILTIVALAAFYFTWRIENKVNNRPHEIKATLKRKYLYAMSLPLVVLVMISIVPNKKEMIQHRISKAKEQKKCVFHEISADKLAYEITNHYYQYNIIDVRSPEEYEKYHLPMAINIPFDEIMAREWEDIFRQKIKTNVFYADHDTLVRMACLKAKHVGKSTNFILKESSDEFKKMFFNISPPDAEAPKLEHEVYNFRSHAAKEMESLVKSLQNVNKPVKKKITKVKGGCS